MRKASDGPTYLLVDLEKDHREVEQMFAELEQLRGAHSDEDKARRKELADEVTIELVRHSVAEEVLVYPLVEKQVSAEEAEHAREEHAEAEETLHRLEKLDASDPAFDDELGTLMREIRHHIDSTGCAIWRRAGAAIKRRDRLSRRLFRCLGRGYASRCAAPELRRREGTGSTSSRIATAHDRRVDLLAA